ncbi:Alkaline phosphatase [Indibacter alkaliphilus LW1]|jgi:alkaline phosphatase|uniref:Alkaline phosphatase n=1 Tax=Indibacter alkaliphilus (strain CCUG 57479 / KCTC 22604 / LW1) TaxID=1189612 RepID=S2D8I5_INDAL|nr:alkaline phosphatase [Indibacter alkaliphilus]EOZ95517.1 Alkaline phosphatase [Indibacter alkaliphilus LW1]
MMKRRDFFKNGLLTTLGLGVMGSRPVLAKPSMYRGEKAKNIIFLVSDGMSTGTLNMADILMRHKMGKASKWISLYESNTVRRSLMDTASANSFVTDSAAAGSAWGGGHRVNNGALNIGPNGEEHEPILQKFKSEGKAVGCVTSVQITHATPASFCVNQNSRSAMPAIAEDYLKLNFDVMMGGGREFFDPEKRVDGKNLFGDFNKNGVQVVKTKEEMLSAGLDKPILGLFSEDGLPYAVDRENNEELKKTVPSLAEMTKKAIAALNQNENGFVMQVEGGKVDWAAHGNDAAALLYDQVDFDEAVGVAMDFAMKDKNTLVIITTDHGNSNPGLFNPGPKNVKFESNYETKASNQWILNQIKPDSSPSQIIDMIDHYQKVTLKNEEVEQLLSGFQLGSDGLYNPGNLPFALYAKILSNHNAISWAHTNHSGDYVELAMYGPGSENLSGMVKNYELHNFMLEAAGVERKRFA